MEWWVTLLLFFGVLTALLLVRIPVAFAFLATNFLLMGVTFGVTQGPRQLIISMHEAVGTFTLTPIPLFILMGEILFRAGVISRIIDSVSSVMGRVPGRLSVISVVGGTAFASVSGSAIANTSVLGSTLLPEMRKRGYSSELSAGPILGTGTLGMLIPPSGVGILLASVAKASIATMMIAILIPGTLLGAVILLYVIVRAWLQPHLAPAYSVDLPSLRDRLAGLATSILPVSLLFILVIGSMFAGIATVTEAGSVGVVGALLVGFLFGELDRKRLVDALMGSMRLIGMILLLFAFAHGFSQLLAFTGATVQLITLVQGLGLPAWSLVVAMLAVVFVMGFFMDQNSIIMITVPLFLPLVTAGEIDLIWFLVMMLIALDLGNLTPPMGMTLFVLKGVAKDMQMPEIYRSAIPIVVLGLLVMALVFLMPDLALWLPGLGDT